MHCTFMSLITVSSLYFLSTKRPRKSENIDGALRNSRLSDRKNTFLPPCTTLGYLVASTNHHHHHRPMKEEIDGILFIATTTIIHFRFERNTNYRYRIYYQQTKSLCKRHKSAFQ